MALELDLLREWGELARKDNYQAAAFYFERLLPAIEPSLRAEHRALEGAYDVLVSLMGFSPETTVVCAMILRPKRLIVVRSGRVDESYELAVDYLVKHAILRISAIDQVEVDPIKPRQIYDAVSERLQRGQSAVVDVTGGKKIMSATAAQAAWALDIPLCYIENDDYDPTLRRPRPGKERLFILQSPSTDRADLARHTALQIYASGNYALAEKEFRASARLNLESAPDDFAALLCSCYRAWMDLDLKRLGSMLDELERFAAAPKVLRLIDDGRLPSSIAQTHALRQVASGETLALLASYLQLATTYRNLGRHDFASLLAYRCHEGLVEEGFRRCTSGAFDTSRPQYALLEDEASLERRYVELSSQIDGHLREAHLPRKIGLLAGFSLLCLVDNLHEQVYERLGLLKAIERMRGITDRRNRSILAHGRESLSEGDSGALIDNACLLAKGVLRDDFPRLQELMARLAPLKLDAW